ncbi:hypothetical protein K8B83_18935 [Shewanella inventionis]|jgi:hypothetical protein|uniref:hypothetical protein n=1 Tax=Shewanella inventionis TaxID=1738770 RepID=UPI001CC04FA2|nr:hypothetical protein [Shewanella inventionis]UAL42868.1 hypothetical protein K8B83_18935 [Shewanella inventionis]
MNTSTSSNTSKTHSLNKPFKLNRATQLTFGYTPNNSKAGYSYEARTVAKIIKSFGGRAATLDEQLKQGIDYVSVTGETIDVKHQPKAFIHGTINVELMEYNTNDPTIMNAGSFLHSKADLYHWCIRDDEVEDVLVFNKEALMPYIERVINGESIVGFLLSNSNSLHAQNESRQHGSSKFDNAVTCRVDIHLVKQIQREYEMKQAGISFN